MSYVPNKFPLYTTQARIAIIGDVPGKDDATFGTPFMGTGGRFLASLLSRAGVSKDSCYLGHVCQYHRGDCPPFSSTEVQDGLAQLRTDMETFKPNIVILLNNAALKAAKDVHNLTGAKFQHSTMKWRGSLFIAQTGPFEGLKCISTHHPSYALRDYDVVPLLQFDIRKAVRESRSPLLNLPKRRFDVDLTPDIICTKLQALRASKTTVAIDIEGGIDTMSCISFAPAEDEAFIFPIYRKDGTHVTTPQMWRELALTLEDENVPKILQNSLYDRFVLHYSYGIRVRGVTHDTMLKHWELYSELEKSLGVQASIYTDEPFYKGDRKAQDDKTFYEYCCRDSAITLEISNRLENMVIGCSLDHYKLNMAMLNPFLYMEMRGMRYDVEGARRRREQLQKTLYEAQARLNGLTGYGFKWDSFHDIRTHANQLFYTKKGDRLYKDRIGDSLRFEELVNDPNPTLATIGELENICEVSLNIGSSKQFQAYIYGILKLPVQMSQKRGETPHPTADYEALLNLSKWCLLNKHDLGFAVCQAAIIISALDTRQGMLKISADKDGRIRCGYNIVGTNTGRVSCYTSPTGSGYNLTTIPNYNVEAEAPGGVLGDRDLFLADEGCYIFQCDLAGADGWTVAAYCAMLGDTTMLDDYKAGIKPYAKIALKIAGRELDYRHRDEVKAAIKRWKMGDLEKLTAKRVQHGGAYLEGGLTISRNVLKDSEGKFFISPQEADKLKNWYIREMYPGIPKWHDWIAARLRQRPILTAASGQVRQFFGRPDDIITKAVAFEPQANTTYATNLAAFRLWTDTDNRIGGGLLQDARPTPRIQSSIDTSKLPDAFRRLLASGQPILQRISNEPRSVTKLRNEPLHQVHDALVGQFKIEDTAWAVGKIKSYFDNPLIIAGQKITIPFDGHYGLAWGGKQIGDI